MKAEIKLMLLQAKTHPGLAADPQMLGGRRSTDSPTQPQKEVSLPTP